MATVSMLHPSIDECIRSNDYEFRQLAIHNQTGTVYINAHAKGYRFFREGAAPETESMQGEVRDRMRLEVV